MKIPKSKKGNYVLVDGYAVFTDSAYVALFVSSEAKEDIGVMKTTEGQTYYCKVELVKKDSTYQ